MRIFKIERNLQKIFCHHGMARRWIIFILATCVVIVIYNILSILSVSSDGYERYKLQELNLSSKRKKLDELLLNSSYNEFELLHNSSQYSLCGLEATINKCETIHIAIVCAGYNASRTIVTLLKSLLFYRKGPLHFHILVDDVAEQILSTLFDTWNLPQVNASFYSIELVLPKVKWIPNRHYSGVYGLSKLTIPKIMPNNLSRIIVLDIDLTFTGNIAELWILFSRFNKKQAIGLVENQSDWYMGKMRWPALGRGFNTGVMLLDLDRLNEINWSVIWRRATVKALFNYVATDLADQDIFNTVIKENPDLLFQLPCQWNVQLSNRALSESCYEKYDIKAIHWNSPLKLQTKNKHVEYFRSIYYTFLELNGDLLRKELLNNCNPVNSTTMKPIEAEICPDFRKAQNNNWRTHIFIREASIKSSPNDVDVTLVAHLSVDRIQMVEELCKHWEGPMSLTIYATDPEVEHCIYYIEHSDILRERTNIAYHVVYKQGHYYPINLLRNIALKYVNTKYVFLSDIDFLPRFGLYAYLKKVIKLLNNDLTKTALVIPAFETQRYRSSFPRHKTQLLQMLDTNILYTFRYHVWANGHAPTNFTRWRTAVNPYKVKWAPDFEPYIVVDRNVPFYDNRFIGFGWNKVSHIMELEAAGYEFVVLPQAFIIHMPHAPSEDIARFRSSPQYRMCLKILKEEFVSDLEKRYGKKFEIKNTLIID